MSQAKVERYKEEKRNRKETMVREKRKHYVKVAVACVICAAFLGWVGFSGYQVYENNKPLETIYTDLTAIDDYMTSLDAE